MKPTLIHCLLGIVLCGLLSAVSSIAATEQGPGKVTINRLADLFEAVNFDHAAHVEIAGNCSTCHHHATGDGSSGGRCARCHAQSPKSAKIACSDCHEVNPFTAAQLERKADDRYQFHVDKPGLKAAYHMSCLGCHQEAGGPTGCDECHPRTEKGDAFYHSGAFAPKASATHAH